MTFPVFNSKVSRTLMSRKAVGMLAISLSLMLTTSPALLSADAKSTVSNSTSTKVPAKTLVKAASKKKPSTKPSVSQGATTSTTPQKSEKEKSQVAPETQPVHITILHVNDVYQLSPSGSGKLGGLARVATLIKQTEAENPNTLFVMAGDTLSPSLATNFFQGAQMIDLWNQLGLDAAVLGNHEFDLGNDVLLKRVAESKFPWLAANVIDKQTGHTFANLPAYVVKDVEGVKLGFLGLLTTDTLHSSHPGANVDFLDPAKVACTNLNAMDKDGAEIILGLTHLAMDEDQKLARQLPMRMTAIIGGHEHTQLQSIAGGTPILKMDSDAATVGRIDLYVDRKNHTLVHMDWKSIPVTEAIAEDPAIQNSIKKYEDKINESLGAPIGATSVMLDARQATSRREETNLGNFLTDSFRNYFKADVALINSGSIRSNTTYPAGQLSRLDILSVLPFGNPMVKALVSGKTILSSLENGVSRLGAEEAGRFPQVSGLRFKYDGRLLAGSRVTEATIAGQLLKADKEYTLATSAYLLQGGDDYKVLAADAKPFSTSLDDGPLDADIIQQAIIAAPNHTIAPAIDGRILRLDK